MRQTHLVQNYHSERPNQPKRKQTYKMRYQATNQAGEIIGYDRYATTLARNLINQGETCFIIADTKTGSVAYQTEPSEHWPMLQAPASLALVEVAK